MVEWLTLVVALLALAVGMALLLVRRFYRARPSGELSAVSRQHIELFQGTQLSEPAVETAKIRFRTLLERGDIEQIEQSFRAGTSFVVHVRALSEIGTDDAGAILERQLKRVITNDPVEQAWYWIDLAGGLRQMNREQCLPDLFECFVKVGDLPLSYFLASEIACFLGFCGFLRQPETAEGRVALRILHRALEGLRFGVQPQVVAEARLGDAVEQLWDHRPERVDALLVRIFQEVHRLLRRVPHARAALVDEASEQEAFQWQVSRMAALEGAMQDYLDEAPRSLCQQLPEADCEEQRDILLALLDLRADAASAILPLLNNPHFAHRELAVEVLTWSRDPQVGLCLRDWAVKNVSVVKRAQRRRLAFPQRRRSVPANFPYQAVLRALRGQPSRETEMFLLLAARDFDPTYRAAAVSSLGWWEPVHRVEVLMSLQQARLDPNPQVRQAARAALARLGERQSLAWFRHALSSEDPMRVHEAVQVVASEGLMLLWPDLDYLADAADAEVAYHAREALERMCEDMHGRSH
ncbi:MAG: hypothetical protein KatS3mg105_4361 [Gemmatales bacterium]|nr:MAG: hypothetical protein KatS3mg105_4361 [Gemmatales bacterium]